MALYKDLGDLTPSNDPIFQQFVYPGHEVPRSGIYRCQFCEHEIAANKGDTMTTQNHAQHPPALGAIVWRLIVATGK